MNEYKQVNFNCPVELLEKFDDAIKGQYNDRTDAILDAMRKLIAELKKERTK